MIGVGISQGGAAAMPWALIGDALGVTLVERAGDWKWSSAAAHEGQASPLSVDPIPWGWLAGAGNQ